MYKLIHLPQLVVRIHLHDLYKNGGILSLIHKQVTFGRAVKIQTILWLH